MDICTPRFWQLHLVPDLKSFLEFSSSSGAFLDICNNAESEYWIKQMIFNCRHWCVCVFFFFFPRPQEHPLLHDRWHQLLSSSKCLRLKPQCNPRQRYSVPRLCKWVCREVMCAQPARHTGNAQCREGMPSGLAFLKHLQVSVCILDVQV